jgi:nucleotide-binding universal stress UspA family protein
MPMIKRALVAVDGSEHANRATDVACAVASRFGAELIAVHVVPDKPLSEAERKMAEVEHGEVARDFDRTRLADVRDDTRLLSQRLTEQAAETARRFRIALGERVMEDAKARARQQAVPSVRTVLREGDPAAAILNLATEESADIIVMGRRGLGDLAGLLARQSLAQGDASRRVCLPHREVRASRRP